MSLRERQWCTQRGCSANHRQPCRVSTRNCLLAPRRREEGSHKRPKRLATPPARGCASAHTSVQFCPQPTQKAGPHAPSSSCPRRLAAHRPRSSRPARSLKVRAGGQAGVGMGHRPCRPPVGALLPQNGPGACPPPSMRRRLRSAGREGAGVPQTRLRRAVAVATCMPRQRWRCTHCRQRRKRRPRRCSARPQRRPAAGRG